MSKFYFSGRELIVENAELLYGSFRNFSGKKTDFNAEGQRNFNLQVDPEYIPMLIERGINVKYFKADLYDEDQSENPGFVKVNVNFKSNRPPIIRVRSGEMGDFVDYTESQTGHLDTMVFDNVDLVLNPSAYDVRGQKGTSLYLNSGYFTSHVDPIAEKYERLKREVKEKFGYESEPEELPFT
ncbi:MAG: hypothetical protein ILA11_10835 [Butyrivibrio sp.]|nr:hypothetical protein [Butyrivibrio sp.]